MVLLDCKGRPSHSCSYFFCSCGLAFCSKQRPGMEARALSIWSDSRHNCGCYCNLQMVTYEKLTAVLQTESLYNY
jgi:hypothetical protein